MNGAPDPTRYLVPGGVPRSVIVPARIARWLDVQLGNRIRTEVRGMSRELDEVLNALRMARFEYEAAAASSARGTPELPQVDELSDSGRGAGPPLDTVAVAELLGCTSRNVRGLAIRGSLRGDCVGGRWSFDPADVDDYLTERARTA